MYAAEKLLSDRDTMRKVVRQDGRALQFACGGLRGDPEVVLEAVRQHGCALMFAARTLRSSREVVLEAVRQNGEALRFAAKVLQNDPEVVLEAVRQDGSALKYAAKELQSEEALEPARAQANAIAVKGARAPAYVIASIRANQSRRIEVEVFTLWGDQVSGLSLPASATLGDLARSLADRHQKAGVVHLVLQGQHSSVSPFDAARSLDAFVA